MTNDIQKIDIQSTRIIGKIIKCSQFNKKKNSHEVIIYYSVINTSLKN